MRLPLGSTLLATALLAQAQQGQRCGRTWDDANSRCGTPCPHDTSEECPAGEDCWSELDGDCHGTPPPPPPGGAGPPVVPPALRGDQRCGTTWNDANGKCGDACPHDTSEECPPGEDCWSELDAPGACAADALAAADRCVSALEAACAGQEHDACDVCKGMDASGAPVFPPAACQSKPVRPALSGYCQPVACQWWQDRHFSPNQVVQAYRHFAYAGTCVAHGRCKDGTAIPGSTMNNQLPQSQAICAAPGQDCCVPTFPDDPLTPFGNRAHPWPGPTLPKPIVKQPRCAVMDTDGLRPPYVHFDDDHRDETSMPGEPSLALVPTEQVTTWFGSAKKSH